MKKISILSLHLGYGGIEKCVTNLANSLCNDYIVEIAVCYKLYKEPAFPIDKRVKIKYLNKNLKPNRKEFMTALKNMVNYIINCHSDIIISTRDLFNYWVGTFAKKSVLKIGWEHNHFHGNYKYATNIVNSCKNLDYLVVVSKELENFYSKKLIKSKCKCLYIPNSIDKLPSKCSSLKNKRFISVGRLSPEKGFLDLLKIYKRVLKKHNDWHLDIVGDGRERKILEDYILDNNLSSNITLHGFQGEDYINRLLDKSSIYLMTSYTESFGIVLIEAMSHGVPCIAFDSAEGAREIINSGKNGYLIKNRNFEAMEKKINDLCDDFKVRKILGENARNDVKKYTSDVVKEEWITLIKESGVHE